MNTTSDSDYLSAIVFPPNLTFSPNLTNPSNEIGFHGTLATGEACQQRTLTPSGHPVLSHLGFAVVFHVETINTFNSSDFNGLEIGILSGTSAFLLSTTTHVSLPVDSLSPSILVG